KDVFGMILEYYERTMTPGNFASLNDPMQFHRVPSIDQIEKSNNTQVAMATDPITLYKESMRQSAAALQAMGQGGGQ
ncbi:MAG: hypothetical protein ACKOE6_04415, partial [Flammeovirgaceae bacterium]